MARPGWRNRPKPSHARRSGSWKIVSPMLPQDNQEATFHRKLPGTSGQLPFLPSRAPPTTHEQTQRHRARRSNDKLHTKRKRLVPVSMPVRAATKWQNPTTAGGHHSSRGAHPVIRKVLPRGPFLPSPSNRALPGGPILLPAGHGEHPGGEFLACRSRGKLPDGSILSPATRGERPASHGKHLGRQLLVVETPWIQPLGAVLAVQQLPLKTCLTPGRWICAD